MMYNKDNKLRSDNYFAFDEYIDTMEQIITNNLKYVYIDSDQLENAKEYFC